MRRRALEDAFPASFDLTIGSGSGGLVRATATYLDGSITIEELALGGHSISSTIAGQKYGRDTKVDPEFGESFALSSAAGRAEGLEMAAEWLQAVTNHVSAAGYRYSVKCGGNSGLELAICDERGVFCIKMMSHPDGVEAGTAFFRMARGQEGFRESVLRAVLA